MNRSFSIRSSKGQRSSGGSGHGFGGGGSSNGGGRKGGFSFTSLRGTMQQPELSRRLYKLIKSENSLVSAHEAAGRERLSIATQLSEWGEKTGDAAVSDLSDKLGVVLSEMGEQEDAYAHALEDSRATLKRIRNTERSVQPSRDGRARIADEIARIKSREPQSAKLVILEQELVRAEAENLVAEAQLVNITRKSLKEAYDAELLATIERAEKQIILARHGRRLLELLDDDPVIPGAELAPYDGAPAGRQILCDCEDDLRDWRPGYGFGSERPSEETAAAAADITPTAAGRPLQQRSANGGGAARRSASGATVGGGAAPQSPKVPAGGGGSGDFVDGPASPRGGSVAKDKRSEAPALES
ncbi:hypothetical protein RB595_007144 [Gaeumannomyces hyphopodioides]